MPRVIINICNELQRSGHKAKILTYRSSANQTDAVQGYKNRAIEICSLNAGTFKLPQAYRQLQKFLKTYQPDIIHDHYGGLWAMGYLLHNKWAERAIYHAHNEFRVIPDSPDKKRSLRTSLFLRYIIPKYAKIVAISNYVKDTLTSLAKVEASQIFVVHNSIDTEHFINKRSKQEDIKQKYGLSEYDVVIGTVGRFVFEKGFDTVLEVLDRLRTRNIEAAALFVGEGDANYEQQVKLRAKELALQKHCRFTGRQENVADYMKTMDVFLFCSRQEPFGITLLEAMACETPIVAVKQIVGGGPDEFLVHRQNALVTDIPKTNSDPDPDTDSDPDYIPNMLATFVVEITEDDELRENLLRNANETTDRFTNKKMNTRMMQVYDI